MRFQISIPNYCNQVISKNIVYNGVLHIPESKESLISLPFLTEKGLNVKLDWADMVITEQKVFREQSKELT